MDGVLGFLSDYRRLVAEGASVDRLDEILDAVLVRLHDCLSLFETGEAIYRFLHTALDNNADPARLGCAVSPILVVVARTTRVPEALCDLAARLARRGFSDVFRDEALFAGLSVQWRHRPHLAGHLLGLVRAGGYDEEPRLVYPLGRVALDYVQQQQLRPPGDGVRRSAVDLLVRLLRSGGLETREWLAPETAELYRSGWPRDVGKVVALALDTPSVEVLVRLERDGALMAFRRAVRAHCELEEGEMEEDEEDEEEGEIGGGRGGRLREKWKAVGRLLHEHWPEEAVEESAGHTAAICPITLDTMRRPVVASDGHTYERTAILRHLVACVGRPTSPLTRQPMTYHLVPNRAVA